jgi:chromate reductase
MKNILIVSSTKNSNFDLSNEIKSFLDKKDDITSSVISLEEFDLPLYKPGLEEDFKKNNSFPDDIEKVKNLILTSDALVWCSPEYNGGVSPILTNVIAWMSRATEDWRDGFKNKYSLICTSSGGNGHNFVKGFSLQLNYLGSNVLEESIVKTKKKNIDYSEFESILTKFYQKL